MPRDGSGSYSVPVGTTAIPNTTIESATFNAFVADLVADLNAVRPIGAGGTGRSALSANVQSLLGAANYAAMFSAIVTANSVTFAKMQQLATMTVIGNVTGGTANAAAVSILDEDDMTTDSATALATQQSIKAYVDAAVAAALAGVSGVETGVRTGFVGLTAPSGWVLADGRTIGNASSNATNRANVDTEDLFTLLWNSYANTQLPILTSAGGASTRGASAAADYAANKALPLPDYRGRAGVGKDDMGGSAASRITASQKHSVAGNTMGAAGGVAEYALTEAEMPSHIHGLEPFETGGGGGTARRELNELDRNTNGTFADTQSTGGDEAHTNLQPSIIENVIIKL